MRIHRTLGIAGALVLAALVGGTLISVVSAAPAGGNSSGTGLTDEAQGAEYCALYLDALAEELGVEPDALAPAAKDAAIATIDAMVANGDLPAELGDRMKARIEAAEGEGCAALGIRFHGFVKHAALAEFREGMWQAAADTLDLTLEDVRQRIAAGESLSEIAEAEGVDYDLVTQAVLDAAAADLATAVEAGRISQERADRRLDGIERWLEGGGQPRPLHPRGERPPAG